MRVISSYQIIDKITGQQIGEDYPIDRRLQARAKTDRMNKEYGNYRYICNPVIDEIYVMV